VSNKIDEDFV